MIQSWTHKIFFRAFFATKLTYEKIKIFSTVFTFYIHNIMPLSQKCPFIISLTPQYNDYIAQILLFLPGERHLEQSKPCLSFSHSIACILASLQPNGVQSYGICHPYSLPILTASSVLTRTTELYKTGKTLF